MFVARKFSTACIVAPSATGKTITFSYNTGRIRELKILNLQTDLLWWPKDLRDAEGSHAQMDKNIVE